MPSTQDKEVDSQTTVCSTLIHHIAFRGHCFHKGGDDSSALDSVQLWQEDLRGNYLPTDLPSNVLAFLTINCLLLTLPTILFSYVHLSLFTATDKGFWFSLWSDAVHLFKWQLQCMHVCVFPLGKCWGRLCFLFVSRPKELFVFCSSYNRMDKHFHTSVGVFVVLYNDIISEMIQIHLFNKWAHWPPLLGPRLVHKNVFGPDTKNNYFILFK